MKKLLLTLLCAPLLMTGCLNGTDYEPPTMPPFTLNQLQFKGKMTATPQQSGSQFEKFELADVEFSIVKPANSEMDNTVTLSLKKVRFAEQMPKLIDCEYRNLILTAWPYDNLLRATPAETDKNIPMYPYYQGLPIDINQDSVPDPEFKTTDLVVEVLFQNDKIAKGGVKFKCNTMEVVIIGDPINTDAPITPSN